MISVDVRGIYKKKCEMPDCRQKINLTNVYSCKCGLFFCQKHRFYTDHDCQYDHKKQHQEKIERENPKVYKKKIKKI